MEFLTEQTGGFQTILAAICRSLFPLWAWKIGNGSKTLSQEVGLQLTVPTFKVRNRPLTRAMLYIVISVDRKGTRANEVDTAEFRVDVTKFRSELASG